ncbi:MAG TPA: prolyl oligopeptidase family serine peptidase [Nakamurella sp.]|nr:prolyl oligopeptidase family serine peptidase [Nakamurella sp.]
MTLNYPPADRDGTVDVLHGVTVADPYRYLEDPDSDRTRAFVRAQNDLSRPSLAALPAATPLLALTTALLTAARRGVPWERGGRYFVIANPGELDQDRLLTGGSLESLLDAPTLLIDPNELSADGTVAMTAAEVSPEGEYVAYALAEAGSDWRTIKVRRTDDGQDLADELRWTKWVDPTWLPDESGFLYWRYPEPSGARFTEAMGAGELVLHRLGDDPASDVLVWSRPEEPEWMASPWVAPDGAWLVLIASPGTDSRTTIQARRLVLDAAGRCSIGQQIADVVSELADAHHVVGSAGDTLYLRTERDAPRGRLVAADLAGPDRQWVDVIAEHPTDVLVDVSPAAGAFVVLWSSDAAHLVEIVDRDGGSLARPELPAPMSVTAINSRDASTEIFVGVTSFTRPARSFRIDLAGGAAGVSALPRAGAEVELPEVSFERVRAASADGTLVPMSVLRRVDLPDGPWPTLLYGYGGFDIPVLPAFSALFSAWVAAGGVLAVANLRGGGEFGADWHRGGMLNDKQNVFDDLFGCARELISSGVTTAAQLAVHGRSNGGLLVGAAITQHPELFAAALPTVGVLDMLRFHLFTIGWAWTTDYGSPDDADDFAVLHGYSPLHRLVPGTTYPPTLICTGDRDDRVVPAHSLKFGAELQHCQGGPGPVLLRVDTRAGHGMGKPARALAAEYADQLAFAAEHTGLDPAPLRDLVAHLGRGSSSTARMKSLTPVTPVPQPPR